MNTVILNFTDLRILKKSIMTFTKHYAAKTVSNSDNNTIFNNWAPTITNDDKTKSAY